MAPLKKIAKTVEKTVLIIPRASFVQKIGDRISSGYELFNRDIQYENDIVNLNKDFHNWEDINRELLKQSFNVVYNEYYHKYKALNTMSGFLDYTRGVDTDSPQYRVRRLKSEIENSLNELKQLIAKSELMDEDQSIKASKSQEIDYMEDGKVFHNRGFVIHGHNDNLKLEVARFIENDLRRRTIILHEQPNKGLTIIEKFEKNSIVDFAVALWTADDQGKSKEELELHDRARQNVIFETGFFIGKLGRSNVIVLYEQGVEIPSDYHGVIFISFSNNWKDDLRKEVNAIYEI